MRVYIVALFLIALTSSVVFFIDRNTRNQNATPAVARGQLIGGTTTISIEYAVTPDEHKKGLSGRATLGEDHGLLFVFDQIGIYPFWMPEMNFAIDIIWIGEDMRIVDIKANATPESYPASFVPSAPARYVLEVETGKSEQWGWNIGTQLSFVQ